LAKKGEALDRTNLLSQALVKRHTNRKKEKREKQKKLLEGEGRGNKGKQQGMVQAWRRREEGRTVMKKRIG